MSDKSKPPASPGLRKAADADVHPSTPQHGDAEPSFLRAGVSTADSVGKPGKDKDVTLDVTVPKSLRKSVRQEAKRRGISVDEVVVEALRARPPR
jgi:hypothetical protein